MMELHVVTECPKTVVECKYLEFGCKYECERRELEEHLRHGMKEHLELSSLEISRLKDKHKKEIQELKREITRQYEKEIQELKREISGKHEKDIQELKREVNGKHEENTQKLRREITSKHDKDIHKLRREMSGEKCAVMKITDFNRKLSEAKDQNFLGDIDGEPFFTSPLGYRIKMYVVLNDTREDCKDHMGVYIKLMKSDHDAILSWPFKKKFTFTLIDQQDNEKERKNIVKTETPEDRDEYKRPENEINTGIGRSCFVSHTTLKTRKYIKDDTVFITLRIEF